MEQALVYLYSALIFLGTINFILYFWLKEIIDFKIKSLFTKGVGRLYIDKTGSFNFKFIQPDKNGVIKINNQPRTISTQTRTHKVFGVNTIVFVSDIPSNIDILEGENKYEGIRCEEIDTHLANMTNGGLLDWFYKWKGYVLIGVLILAAGVVATAYFGNQNYEWVKDGANIAVNNYLQVK